MPHSPWLYLPSGCATRARRTALPYDGEWWAATRPPAAHHQLGYTDRLLGEALRALEEAGLYDEPLIVVTSDHGVSFSRGSRTRAGRRPAAPRRVAWVPLFIKAARAARGSGRRPQLGARGPAADHRRPRRGHRALAHRRHLRAGRATPYHRQTVRPYARGHGHDRRRRALRRGTPGPGRPAGAVRDTGARPDRPRGERVHGSRRRTSGDGHEPRGLPRRTPRQRRPAGAGSRHAAEHGTPRHSGRHRAQRADRRRRAGGAGPGRHHPVRRPGPGRVVLRTRGRTSSSCSRSCPATRS